jgi:hypothetical protein
MVAPIDVMRLRQYGSELSILLQQSKSKFRGTMTEKGGYRGERVSPVNQIGEIQINERAHRIERVRPTEVDLARRWVKPRVFTGSTWSRDPIDVILTNMTMDGPYSDALRKGMNRRFDDVAIEAFEALALVGEQGDSSVALPGSAVISTDLGGAGSDLNNAKLIGIRKYFEMQEADLDEEMIFMAISPQQSAALLGVNTTLSSDYVDGRPQQTGKVPPMFGINFVVTNRLPKVGNVRTGYAWLMSGMHAAWWMDVEVTVDRIPEMHNAHLIQASASWNVTRLEEKKVVKVLMTEPA